MLTPTATASKTPDSPRRAPRQDSTDDATHTRTILVVDDQAVVLGVVERMLRQLGLRVHATTSPHEALRILQDDADIDLLLTDVRMPEIGGIDLARRARKLRPQLPVLFMSAFVDADESAGPLNGPLLPKPFTRYDLEQQVLALLA